jgi:uncharacterized spore protein YtfJ
MGLPIRFNSRLVAEADVVSGDTRLTPLTRTRTCAAPFGAFVWSRPVAVDVHDASGVGRLKLRNSRKDNRPMIETMNGVTSTSPTPLEMSDKTVEKLAELARPHGVYSAPVISGAYTVITASEVFGGGGFGFGGAPSSGEQPAMAGAGEPGGGAGGGGGSGFYARPVASIVIGPEGVKIQPIADATKIAIAMMSVWAGVAVMALRMARASSRRKL